MKNKNVLLFRGNFDPIHIGHINTIKDMLELMDVDYKGLGRFNDLWVLPTYRINKSGKDGIHRMNMLHLSLLNNITLNPRLKICTLELDMHNTASLYKTLVFFNKHYPTYNFSILMGANKALSIRGLKYSRKLVRETTFVVRSMYGYNSSRYSSGNYRWFVKPPNIYLSKTQIKQEDRNVFSSKIRNYISSIHIDTTQKYKDLTTSVQEYILTNNLYRGTKNLYTKKYN